MIRFGGGNFFFLYFWHIYCRKIETSKKLWNFSFVENVEKYYQVLFYPIDIYAFFGVHFFELPHTKLCHVLKKKHVIPLGRTQL
jgi:hypothetical protein